MVAIYSLHYLFIGKQRKLKTEVHRILQYTFIMVNFIKVIPLKYNRLFTAFPNEMGRNH